MKEIIERVVVKLRTGNGWLLTEEELVCLESEVVNGGYPPLNLGEWRQWANQYTEDSDITWAGLAETIRKERAKELQEYQSAVDKIISTYNDAVDTAKHTAETELGKPVRIMRQRKTLGDNAANTAIETLREKGFIVQN